MDVIYDVDHNALAAVYASGDVRDIFGEKLGHVSTCEAGRVLDGQDLIVGRVDGLGFVRRESDGSLIGRVTGSLVYDDQDNLVGMVTGRQDTIWNSAITDARRAGAALLLLNLTKRRPKRTDPRGSSGPC